MTREVMKILTSIEPLPLYITRTPPPWNQRNPIPYNKSLNGPKFHPRKWALHAEAKGFNRLQQQKDGANEARKSYRRNNNGEDNDDKIPDVVWERILFRILFYVGVPLVAGIFILQVFGTIKEQNLWDVPIWLPFLTTFITFGASALGIAYGTLSTSWDPEREGSFLGFEEAQKNWVDMWKEEDDDD
ncbi:hypothetical protein ACH5RR_017158 [Cinchona calisaya]|uniref:Uncharacterized protein n=1 Tax=Cinchona calisaya TaxID=153742 RepID=A0ABD2ZXZ4_9GENT